MDFNKTQNFRTNRIQELIDLINSGNFNRSDIGLLILWLRPVTKENAILSDLANYIAHNDCRDQGISFNRVLKYIINFIDVAENGGKLLGPQPVFNKDEIIRQSIVTFKRLKLNYRKDKMEYYKKPIENLLCSQNL
ncbi:hypothetical protein KAZ66_05150 [Candidatus Woesebacteria bacterium]|nr:hypothetical protein [Candidatus Woesebacteria bacterium]